MADIKARPLSSAHLEAYLSQGIIPKDFIRILTDNCPVMETECIVCEYIAKIKKKR
jgi:hypothetical protein